MGRGYGEEEGVTRGGGKLERKNRGGKLKGRWRFTYGQSKRTKNGREGRRKRERESERATGGMGMRYR